MFSALFILAGPPAWADEPGDCPVATSMEQFLEAARRGEDAFAAMDLLALSEARQQALGGLPCLQEPVTTCEAAAFHRMMAMAAFTSGDEQGVLREFHAARRLEPGYQIPATVAPAGHPLVLLYERSAAVEEGGLDPAIPPRDGYVTVDGVRGAPRPNGISTIIQVFDDQAALQETLHLPPGEPLPAWGPLPVDGLRRQRRRVALLSSAGVSLAAAGALFGLAAYSEARFWDEENPVATSDLPSQRVRTIRDRLG